MALAERQMVSCLVVETALGGRSREVRSSSLIPQLLCGWRLLWLLLRHEVFLGPVAELLA